MRLLNVRPRSGVRFVLGAIPLIVIALLYVMWSEARHFANAADKVLPTLSQMGDAIIRMWVNTDPLSGRVPAWADTWASLSRLWIALGISTSITLLVGLALGLLPAARATFGPLIAAIAVIPPIAVLPILFIALGLGETAKVTLIVFGVTPFMTRDFIAQVQAIPSEQIIKAQTLGASTWQVALRVALPQALPRLIDSLRLSLGPAWVFLISAEAIASDVGLGYRIFLVRRYLAMDVILPYVAWISVLAILHDVLLSMISKRAFPWAHAKAPA